ncbi:MAG: hypothetical protein EAZ89_14515 [Bacteroidetes bacterium]|nr:MAG: hypothetical protein EAZ89_14515 [Bacteroidota bacterium]
MKTPLLLIPLVGLCLVMACTAHSTSSLTQSSAYSQNGGEPIQKSLFNDPDRSISEEDIQRLLSGDIQLPENARLAIYNVSAQSRSRSYGGTYYAWNDEEYLKTQQGYVDSLTSSLARSERIRKITLMPTLMSGEGASITQLREATVRLQSDLLLIYSVKSDIYYRYKVFSADEAKAFATCEALLLDIRTGLVPYSTIFTREQLARKKTSGSTIEEVRKEAERQAVTMALQALGEGVREFLKEP